MADYQIGDIVVLTAGSMRMAVENVDGEMISTVWCNEGQIGRDTFDARLIKKWEHREDTRGAFGKGGGDRGGFKGRDDRGGDRGGYKGRDDRGGDRGGDRPDRGPRPPMGRDGKPKDRKFFRKD